MCRKLICMIAMGFVLGLISSSSVVSADTIAYWRFDDVGDAVIDVPAGSVAPGNALPDSDGQSIWRKAAHDHSGNGNHLTTWDSAWAGHVWSSDVPAGTVPLTGASNALSIVNSGNFPCAMTWSEGSNPSGIDLESITPAAFTIEISFKLTQLTIPGDFWLEHITLLGRDGMNIVNGSPGLAPLNLGVWPGNTLIVRFGDLAGYDHVAESAPGAVTTDQWYNLVAVSDGSTLSLYLDTSLVAQTDLTASGSTNTAMAIGTGSGGDWQAATWTIGRGFRGGAHTDRVFGYIDEVRISDSALPRSEFLFLSGYSAVNYPLNGATDVAWDTVLSWMPGAYAATHDVYFGTDINDVNNADITDTTGIYRGNQDLDDTSYSPTEAPLEWNKTYYWRVDEVNEAHPDSPWKGDIWSFTTVNYIVLEDFEDYSDNPPDEIWNTWIDGFGDSSNGSVAGYPDPDFIAGEHYVETDIVHGGSQSMPLFYNNGAGLYSEVTKTLTEMCDWTTDDVITLTLYYYGDFGNSLDTMYFALNGSAVIDNEDPRAVLTNEWTQWDILLQDFAAQGVNLTNVNSISIGIGDRNNPKPSGSGHVFFDDIRLSRLLPTDDGSGQESVDPGTDNLRAYYAFENNVQDTSGRGQNGIISGNPEYISGPTDFGMSLTFGGSNFVTLPIGSLISSLTDTTIATWVNWSGQGGAWQRIFDFGSGTDINMFITPNAAGSLLRFAITSSGNANEDQTNASMIMPTGWHHVAVTIDPANTTHTLYLDGKVAAQNTSASIVPSDLGQTTQNWLGLSQYPGDPYFYGTLDEFRIYDRVLSVAELLYLAGK